MRESTYKKKCETLFERAKRKGVKLNFNPENFSPDRLDCLWYGGEIATIEFDDGLIIQVYANGEVGARLYDKAGNELARSKDKSNRGAFEDNMRDYLTSDRQLFKEMKEERLILDSNNWIEYDGFIKENGKKVLVDLYEYFDNILDGNILVAIGQVLKAAKTKRKEILFAKES